MRIPLTFRNEKHRSHHKERGSSLDDALEYYRLGNFDDAHSIVQNDDSAEAAYIHGMLHRREGDYYNAKYWFNRARQSDLYKYLVGAIESFDPLQFVDQCQSAETRLQQQRAEELQYLEWATVKEFVAKTVAAK